MTVNASGAWAGSVAEMAGIEGVRVLPGRGIMIAMNHRLVNTCVNRCQMPTDGDIIVPIRTVCVIGTTDVHTDDPDDHTVLRRTRSTRCSTTARSSSPASARRGRCGCGPGVRPLFEDAKASDTDTRDVTRAHAMLDHAERDGVTGFVTITGGKLTTFRLMAEDTMAAVSRHLGEERPCTTKTEPLPGSENGATYHLGERLGRKEARLADDQLICECEMVPRWKLEEAVQRRATTNLDDIRRLLRLGMGPCQGGFCIYRATGILHGLDGLTAEQADESLLHFLRERWKGVWPILYGDQLRQARLDDWIFQGVLDVEHLPAPQRGGGGVVRGELHYDAVVIGAGTAGLVAGARLAEGGARVCVLAKGIGSTHLAPGTIDVLGYAPERVSSRRGRARAVRREPARSSVRAARRRCGGGGGALVRSSASARPAAPRLPLRRRPRAQHAAADGGRRAPPVGARARDDGRRRRALARARVRRGHALAARLPPWAVRRQPPASRSRRPLGRGRDRGRPSGRERARARAAVRRSRLARRRSPPGSR